MIVVQVGVKTDSKIYSCGSILKWSKYVMWISEYTELTLLTVHAALELCLYRAAKIS
jgi:hypothetical protein